MNSYKYLLPLVFLALGFQSMAEETPWDVPQENDEKTAPFMFNEEAVEAGKTLYINNCKSCHGDVGEMNMIPLDPLPKDLSIDQVKVQSDGSLYYKIREGRGAMPSFKNILSVNDVWNVVAYIRSYHTDYIQPVPSKGAQFSGTAISLSLKWMDEEKALKVIAMGEKDGADVPAEGVEIDLYAKRYFGNLKIGDTKASNKAGEIIFNLPETLPGDTAGNIELTAKVLDVEKYGEAEVTQMFTAGKPTNKPGLTEKRAMWNVGKKAPWWITITYPMVVLGVLATLGYIFMLMRKVFLLGRKEEE